jgi:hypothetical protein
MTAQKPALKQKNGTAAEQATANAVALPVSPTQYDHIPRSGLIRMLQEHDAALLDAGMRAPER